MIPPSAAAASRRRRRRSSSSSTAAEPSQPPPPPPPLALGSCRLLVLPHKKSTSRLLLLGAREEEHEELRRRPVAARRHRLLFPSSNGSSSSFVLIRRRIFRQGEEVSAPRSGGEEQQRRRRGHVCDSTTQQRQWILCRCFVQKQQQGLPAADCCSQLSPVIDSNGTLMSERSPKTTTEEEDDDDDDVAALLCFDDSVQVVIRSRNSRPSPDRDDGGGADDECSDSGGAKLDGADDHPEASWWTKGIVEDKYLVEEMMQPLVPQRNNDKASNYNQTKLQYQHQHSHVKVQRLNHRAQAYNSDNSNKKLDSLADHASSSSSSSSLSSPSVDESSYLATLKTKPLPALSVAFDVFFAVSESATAEGRALSKKDDDDNNNNNFENNVSHRGPLLLSALKRQLVGCPILMTAAGGDCGEAAPSAITTRIRLRNCFGKTWYFVAKSVSALQKSSSSQEDRRFATGSRDERSSPVRLYLITPSTKITLFFDDDDDTNTTLNHDADRAANQLPLPSPPQSASLLSPASQLLIDTINCIYRIETSRNAEGGCSKGNVPRAFLLTGPPGVGKVREVPQSAFHNLPANCRSLTCPYCCALFDLDAQRPSRRTTFLRNVTSNLQADLPERRRDHV